MPPPPKRSGSMEVVSPVSVAFSHSSQGTRPSSASSTSAAIGLISRAAKVRASSCSSRWSSVRERLTGLIVRTYRTFGLEAPAAGSLTRGGCRIPSLSMATERLTGATAFDGIEQAYERVRPTYAIEAILTALLLAGAGDLGDVADLAAGTGKLTRLLVRTRRRSSRSSPRPRCGAASGTRCPTSRCSRGAPSRSRSATPRSTS